MLPAAGESNPEPANRHARKVRPSWLVRSSPRLQASLSDRDCRGLVGQGAAEPGPGQKARTSGGELATANVYWAQSQGSRPEGNVPWYGWQSGADRNERDS